MKRFKTIVVHWQPNIEQFIKMYCTILSKQHTDTTFYFLSKQKYIKFKIPHTHSTQNKIFIAILARSLPILISLTFQRKVSKNIGIIKVYEVNVDIFVRYQGYDYDIKGGITDYAKDLCIVVMVCCGLFD